jgi:hypothetical protein
MCSKLSSGPVRYVLHSYSVLEHMGRCISVTEITVRITNSRTANFGAECFELFGRFKVLRQILRMHRLHADEWSGFNPRHFMGHLGMVTRGHYFLKVLQRFPLNYYSTNPQHLGIVHLRSKYLRTEISLQSYNQE